MNGKANAEYRKEAAELLETIRSAQHNVKDRNVKFAKDASQLVTLNKAKKKSKKLRDIPEFSTAALAFKQEVKDMTKDVKQARKQLNKVKEKYGISTKTVYECWKEAYDLDMKYLKEKAAE